jgi:hypothetical protein
MGRRDLKMMQQGTMDPEGRGQTQAGMVCGIIGTCLAIFLIVVIAILIVVYVSVLVWAGNMAPPTVPAPPPASSQRKMNSGGGVLRFQDYFPRPPRP